MLGPTCHVRAADISRLQALPWAFQNPLNVFSARELFQRHRENETFCSRLSLSYHLAESKSRRKELILALEWVIPVLPVLNHQLADAYTELNAACKHTQTTLPRFIFKHRLLRKQIIAFFSFFCLNDLTLFVILYFRDTKIKLYGVKRVGPVFAPDLPGVVPTARTTVREVCPGAGGGHLPFWYSARTAWHFLVRTLLCLPCSYSPDLVFLYPWRLLTGYSSSSRPSIRVARLVSHFIPILSKLDGQGQAWQKGLSTSQVSQRAPRRGRNLHTCLAWKRRPQSC